MGQHVRTGGTRRAGLVDRAGIDVQAGRGLPERRAGDGAPVVVARGERLLAERIKQVARQAGVPIFRDVALAHALGQLADGQEIPAALYEAVAEILRAVYAMDGAGAKRG